MNSSGDAAGGYPMASQALFAQRQDVLPIINPVGEVHHGKAEHILVVEDNDGLREIATRILTRAGYEVTAVAARDRSGSTGRSSGGHTVILTRSVTNGYSRRSGSSASGGIARSGGGSATYSPGSYLNEIPRRTR